MFKSFKMYQTAETFCEKNDCMFLQEALQMCYELEKDDEPEYSTIRFKLVNSCLDQNIAPGGRFQRKAPEQNVSEIIEIPDENNLVW